MEIKVSVIIVSRVLKQVSDVNKAIKILPVLLTVLLSSLFVALLSFFQFSKRVFSVI